MSKEEPRWKAGLRGSLEALAESAFERGPGLTEAGMEIILPHIKAAEQRGFQAGVNKTGDSVGKLREQLKTARADARREAAAEIREHFRAGFSRATANLGVVPAQRWIQGGDKAADLIDPDSP